MRSAVAIYIALDRSGAQHAYDCVASTITNIIADQLRSHSLFNRQRMLQLISYTLVPLALACLICIRVQ
jgi:hypothetical protein